MWFLLLPEFFLFRAWRERFRREPLIILPDYCDSDESDVSIPIDSIPIDMERYYNDDSDSEFWGNCIPWDRDYER